MRFPSLLPAALALLLTTASCSQAQSDTSEKGDKKAKNAKGGDRRKDKTAASEVQGLVKVGSLKGVVPESSGLAQAPKAGHYYSFGDDGNRPILYEITGTGEGAGKLDVPADNTDWESLSRDGQGNYYIGDCGNNESTRHDLRIIKFRPDTPAKAGIIAFQYPDQNEFPPKKKQRNFDCEASLWHDGRVWLFTKDRGQSSTSNVYSVPDQPGDYTAKKVGAIAIPGQVTDAALRPDGRRLVLLGRGELFILDGNSWADILKATPRQVALTGAGQTEGAVFKDDKTLLISTEQGGLFEYTLP
ncbi:hypothetical protein ACFST9_06425 [Hymenobacter monticola]|uniref:SdiA-regulated family protein n=1 Tax=Hymenobacter monticola TaxID=1705399 RepID=A0ABY4BE22_9BACT|nr:hypothetical protein [Hymenobacter monticola]UOE36251.1 hypothetical protein MTP16_11550 [Hymenobacter monticola]